MILARLASVSRYQYFKLTRDCYRYLSVSRYWDQSRFIVKYCYRILLECLSGSSSLKGMKVYFPQNIDLHGITLELKLVWQLYQHKMAILSKRILFCVTHFSNFNQKKLFVDSANLKKYINYSKKRQIVKENSNLVYIIHVLFWFHTFFQKNKIV